MAGDGRSSVKRQMQEKESNFRSGQEFMYLIFCHWLYFLSSCRDTGVSLWDDVSEICSCRGENISAVESIWWKNVHIRPCCCIAVQDPLYLSPLTTCNRNVETLVQRHSCLRSLTSWAKCLRNAPCQCTAHATARADIRLFKSENFPRIRIFSFNKYEISIRNKEPDGYWPG